MRHLPATDYLSLKAAFRDLVKFCGGSLRCSHITRGSQSRISEYGAPDHPERYPAIDQIADLEAECGHPLVTRQLASLAGYDLVSRETRPAATHTVLEHLSKVIRETADVSSTIAQGMADGSLDPAERREIIREIDEAVRELLDLKTDMAPGLKEVGS